MKAPAYIVKMIRQTAVRNSLAVAGAEQDFLDPTATHQVSSGWEIVDNTYQGLVAPNGLSVTGYLGRATDWIVSSDGMTYAINICSSVIFSDSSFSPIFPVSYRIKSYFGEIVQIWYSSEMPNLKIVFCELNRSWF
ncbi:MAG TPA: hypothetical protein VJZ03_03030 [Candidatus Bathyarchaeia archaeon]|nr:hypothetical protein [Candidatus Bathyarchaeia archaeon]